MSSAAILEQGLVDLRLRLPGEAVKSLLTFVELLMKWNQTHNLTSIRDRDDVMTQHLLDSLAVLPHLPKGSLVDIGSGAGLPGIPIAIAEPERSVSLLDSNGKKAAFLQQARMELDLAGVSIHCTRVETWRPVQRFRVVISRGFSRLAEFCRVAGHLVADDGVLAAMKGKLLRDEIEELGPGWRCESTHRLEVPGLLAERHLVLCAPVTSG